MQVIPGAKDAGYKVQAYAFKGYWEDIGTVEAFYNSNLALANPEKAQFRWAQNGAGRGVGKAGGKQGTSNASSWLRALQYGTQRAVPHARTVCWAQGRCHATSSCTPHEGLAHEP